MITPIIDKDTIVITQLTWLLVEKINTIIHKLCILRW